MPLPLRYNYLSLAARPTTTISSLGLIAVVIATFAYLQAVTDSAFNTMMATGDPNTVLVIAQSADSETVSPLDKDMLNKLEMVSGGVREEKGPVISPEIVAISSAQTPDSGDAVVNAAVRGVDFEKANKIRHGRIKLIEGRAFNAGTYEVIIGKSANKLYLHHNIGDEVQLGTRGIRNFKIVGIFDTGGTAADSEIWGYVETVRDVYSRERYSSARLLARDAEDARQMIAFIQGPSINLTAKTERDYFMSLRSGQETANYLSIAMIIIMGIAAAFAVANTMYAAVAGRTREIGVLRAVGFGKVSILSAFVLEGLLLSVSGGVLGCLISLACNGMQRKMLPATFTTVSYTLAITWKIIGTSLAVAMAIGLMGSIMPAWRASRLSVVKSLREP